MPEFEFYTLGLAAEFLNKQIPNETFNAETVRALVAHNQLVAAVKRVGSGSCYRYVDAEGADSVLRSGQAGVCGRTIEELHRDGELYADFDTEFSRELYIPRGELERFVQCSKASLESESSGNSARTIRGSGNLKAGSAQTSTNRHIVGSSNPDDPTFLSAKHPDIYQQEMVRLKAQEDYQEKQAAKRKPREIEFTESVLIGSTRYPAGCRASFTPDEAAEYVWRGWARDPRTGEQGERFTGTNVLRVDDISQDQGIVSAIPCSPGTSATPQAEPAVEEKRGVAGADSSGNLHGTRARFRAPATKPDLLATAMVETGNRLGRELERAPSATELWQEMLRIAAELDLDRGVKDDRDVLRFETRQGPSKPITFAIFKERYSKYIQG